jgi:hypothetical protein
MLCFLLCIIHNILFLSFPKTLPMPPPLLKPPRPLDLPCRCSCSNARPPNDAGIATPPGDRFLGCQLATEVVARVLAPDDATWRKEKARAPAWKPSALALLLWLRCPAADGGGGRIRI